MKRLFMIWLCALMLLSIATSCTTVKMNSWLNPNFKDRKLGKTMILAVSDSSVLRQQFEDMFVKRLKELGVDAITSIEYLPEEKRYSEEELKTKLRETGCDSIIVTAIVGERDGIQYVPPMRYPDYYGYYGWSYSYVQSPGYIYNYTEMDLQTNIYDAETGKMIWSGETQITDNVSKHENIRAVTRAAVKAIEKSGII